MSPSARKNALIATGVWVVAFVFGPLLQLKFGTLMPGDLGDPRLNNYFLENIYQVLIGRADSLWHLGFFYPYPWILGLSDNLFGASPVYLAARLVSLPSDTSFQIWYLASYAANYAAAYIALRRLKLSPAGSIVGALIFTFALPVPSQFQHVQLLYRFGAALAIGGVGRFLADRNWRHLYAAGGWLVWQFFCSIYIGFFTLVFLGAIVGIYALGILARQFMPGNRPTDELVGHPRETPFAALASRWGALTMRDRLTLVGGPLAGVGALVWLFYPYLQSSRIFNAGRSFPEIEKDMPRLWSYLVSDHSLIWAHNARVLGVGHFEEHQLFIGLVALVLFALGTWYVATHPTERTGRTLAAAVGITFVLSLDVGGHSLWQPLVHLPLFSAIRVVTRFDLVWLFPIGYLAALAFDRVIAPGVRRTRASATARSGALPWVAFGVVAALLVGEYSLVVPSTTTKAEWRARIEAADSLTPANLSEDAILAFATPEAPWHCAMELDAMWVALNRGVYTMNGYAGFGLPGYNFPAGSDRSRVVERLGWYLVYAGEEGNVEAYQTLANQVVLVGFDEADTADTTWLTSPHTFTLAGRPYTDAELAGLSLRVVGSDPARGFGVVDIDISNAGTVAIAAESFAEQQVNVVWRYVRPDGGAGIWHRRALPCDIAPGESVRMRVLIDEAMGEGTGAIEFGFEQAGVTSPFPLGTPESRVEWTDR